jgi:FkbM family methyltransferase
MRVGGRDLTKIADAVLRRRNYIAAINMVRLYDHPVAMFRRYLTGSGEYPCSVRVRTPQSELSLRLYSPDDLLTVNEIFCRDDYHADIADKVIVDFGSNIGISAAYFLTRNPSAFTYLFEPLPSNVTRLRDNLRAFDGRYELKEVAVGISEGDVEFGWEESGRYGGVNNTSLGNTLTVPCVNSRTVLEKVIAEHGRIDILKVDIEGLEAAVIANIPVELARKIKKLYVEAIFETNPLAQTHSLVHYGGIAQFHLLNSQSA